MAKKTTTKKTTRKTASRKRDTAAKSSEAPAADAAAQDSVTDPQTTRPRRAPRKAGGRSRKTNDKNVESATPSATGEKTPAAALEPAVEETGDAVVIRFPSVPSRRPRLPESASSKANGAVEAPRRQPEPRPEPSPPPVQKAAKPEEPSARPRRESSEATRQEPPRKSDDPGRPPASVKSPDREPSDDSPAEEGSRETGADLERGSRRRRRGRRGGRRRRREREGEGERGEKLDVPPNGAAGRQPPSEAPRLAADPPPPITTKPPESLYEPLSEVDSGIDWRDEIDIDEEDIKEISEDFSEESEPADSETEDDSLIDEETEEVEPDRRRHGGRRGRGRGRLRGREREEREHGEVEDRPVAAPRPKVRREMIINATPGEECRIAILENSRLEEIYLERASAENSVGNIYKGVVTNVEASIQAAFIDYGMGKNGFLHISDLHPQHFPNGEGSAEKVGQKTPRRSRPPIQKCLRRGQTLLVQITKEGIGTKGPTLTTYLSIPGRYLVMMPGMRRSGVSRKIEDEDIRQQVRQAMRDLDLSSNMGFIARTAAAGHSAEELQADLNYLTRLWRAVERRIKDSKAPAELYRESDLVIRTIRDVFASDVAKIIVDDAETADRAREFLNVFSPNSGDIVTTYKEPAPIFARFGIEEELERLHSRRVPLKSGGSLVIDQTEALVAIDVNSGRFRSEDDAETTAYKINLEAADEIARQLRLRDMGGVVVCDFIDMRLDKHRRAIENRLNDNLKQHKERVKLLRISQFGLLELTRQRQRASLTRNVYQDCAHCNGTGLVKTPESVALDIVRQIQFAALNEAVRSIDITVSPQVSELLLNRRRRALVDLEARHNVSVTVRADARFSLDQVKLERFDQRMRLVAGPGGGK